MKGLECIPDKEVSVLLYINALKNIRLKYSIHSAETLMSLAILYH